MNYISKPIATAFVDTTESIQDKLMHDLLAENNVVKAVAVVNPDQRVMAVFYDNVSKKSVRNTLYRITKRRRKTRDTIWDITGFSE